MSFEPGHISLVQFPRSDLQEGKYRPVLLLSKMPGPFNDWLICAITSQLRHKITGWDEKIVVEDDDFEKSELKASLLIRVGKLATVEEGILEGVLGEVSHKSLGRILNRLSVHLEGEISDPG